MRDPFEKSNREDASFNRINRLLRGNKVSQTLGRFLFARIDLETLQGVIQSGTLHPVSQIPNRAHFERSMGHLLHDRARPYVENMGMLFFDMIGFKKVNDMYGFSTGDKSLALIGQGLQRHSRQAKSETYKNRVSDIVVPLSSLTEERAIKSKSFHLAGDEFLVLAQAKNKLSLVSAGRRIAVATLLDEEMVDFGAGHSLVEANRPFQLGLRAGGVMMSRCFDEAKTPAGRLEFMMEAMDPKQNTQLELIATYLYPGEAVVVDYRPIAL